MLPAVLPRANKRQKITMRSVTLASLIVSKNSSGLCRRVGQGRGQVGVEEMTAGAMDAVRSRLEQLLAALQANLEAKVCYLHGRCRPSECIAAIHVGLTGALAGNPQS